MPTVATVKSPLDGNEILEGKEQSLHYVYDTCIIRKEEGCFYIKKNNLCFASQALRDDWWGKVLVQRGVMSNHRHLGKHC